MEGSGFKSPDENRPNDTSRIDLTVTLYEELRRLATARMSIQLGVQTLQATALLHEAWLKLGGNDQPKWKSRAHFFRAVAQTMRHILVDSARRRSALRHGGGMKRVNLNDLDRQDLDSAQAKREDGAILLVNEVMENLSRGDPETADLVKLHYFAGLSIAEAAEAMNISQRTAQRRLTFARYWLRQELRGHLSRGGQDG